MFLLNFDPFGSGKFNHTFGRLVQLFAQNQELSSGTSGPENKKSTFKDILEQLKNYKENQTEVRPNININHFFD